MTSRADLYDVDGDEAEAKRETCPRCGDSFLARHGDRQHCGRCGYTEWD
ncbi:MAG: 30S ribosomal protein S27ae [Halobacteriota archaeon]